MKQKVQLEPAWRALLGGLGVSPTALLRRAALPADLLDTPGQRLDVEGYARLWAALEALVDDPTLGLRLGSMVSLDMFDPGLFAAMCSPDLTTALERLGQHKRWIGPCRLQVETLPTFTRVNCTVAGLPEPPYAFGVAESVFWLRMVRHGTRAPIRPLQVVFPRLPADPSPYEAFFRVPIQQGRGFELRFSARDAARPFVTPSPGTWELMAPLLARRQAQQADPSAADRVEDVLLTLLPSGRSQKRDAAKALSMSPRTLQRRLKAEGTTFQQLLAETRERLARHYLRHTDRTPTEVAFLLGFDDPTSLYRALQRWTGSTPQDLRQAAD